MAIIEFGKYISQLPTNLKPNTIYLVRTGQGFDLYATDITGNNALKINPPLPMQQKGSSLLFGTGDNFRGNNNVLAGYGNEITGGDGKNSNNILIGRKNISHNASNILIGHHAKGVKTGGIALGCSWGEHSEFGTVAGHDCFAGGYNVSTEFAYASVAVGTNLRVHGYSNVVIGGGSQGDTTPVQVKGNNNTVIGSDNKILGIDAPRSRNTLRTQITSPNTTHNSIIGSDNTINNNSHRNVVFGGQNTVNGNNNLVFASNQTITGNNQIYLGGRVVHGVATGAVDANSTDAINGAQLHQLLQRVQQLEARVVALEAR